MKSSHSLSRDMPPFVVAILGADDGEEPELLGSGWNVALGIVVTCRHVIENAGGQRAANLFIRRSDENVLIIVKEAILSGEGDLALLRIEPQIIEPPKLMTGLYTELLPKLRSLPWSAFGFEAGQEPVTLKRYPLHESLLLMGSLADTGTITDLQFSGGLPTGFSGGPLTWSCGGAWLCSGMIRLGRIEAATSRAIAADTIREFLDEHQVGYCSVSARTALDSDFLNSAVEQQLEVREVVALITDMADSTAFAAKFGSRAAYEKRLQHNQLLVPVIGEYGGRLVEVVGDALLAVFDAPPNAARCAIAMQQRLQIHNRFVDLDTEEFQIHVRIGMHFGKALIGHDAGRLWVVGHAVNVAARVESGAGKKTDRIVVSGAMAGMLAANPEFTLEPMGVIDAKGIGDLELFLLWGDRPMDGTLAAAPPTDTSMSTLAAATGVVNNASKNQGVCHCVFIDSQTGQGAIVPILVSIQPASEFAVTCVTECDPVADAAARRAVRAVFNELANLGFASMPLERLSVSWQVNRPQFRAVETSLGLGVALAAVSAYTGVPIDPGVAVTGSVDDERIQRVDQLAGKWSALSSCPEFHTLILPSANGTDLPTEAWQDLRLRIIDVPTVRAAIVDVFGAGFGLAARRFAAATTPVAAIGDAVQIELWVKPAADKKLTRDIAIVSQEDTHTWRIGNDIRICARTSRDCHLAVANIGTSGRVTVLLPNEDQPETWVEAETIVTFPSANARFSFQLQGPPGIEKLVAIASSRRLRLGPADFFHNGKGVARPTTRDIAIVADNVADSIVGRTEIQFYVTGASDAQARGPAGRFEPQKGFFWRDLW